MTFFLTIDRSPIRFYRWRYIQSKDKFSTTSNMGTTVIIPDRSKRPNLASIAKHGFTIEVGPMLQGVLHLHSDKLTTVICRSNMSSDNLVMIIFPGTYYVVA